MARLFGNSGIGEQHFAIVETGIRMDFTSFRPSRPYEKLKEELLSFREYVSRLHSVASIRKTAQRCYQGGINLNIPAALWYVNKNGKGRYSLIVILFAGSFSFYLLFRPVLSLITYILFLTLCGLAYPSNLSFSFSLCLSHHFLFYLPLVSPCVARFFQRNVSLHLRTNICKYHRRKVN